MKRVSLALLYGVLCHGSFALAIYAMVRAMYFGMSTCSGGLHGPLAWISNGLLVLQFPFLHSFLLTRPGGKWLARMAPAGLGVPLSSTIYALVASIQVLLLFTLWSPSGSIWWQASGALLPLFQALYAGAWLLLFRSMLDGGLALQLGLLGWWAVLLHKAPVYPGMPTRGLFRLCRQPIYLCFALTLWTVPTWTPDQLGLAVGLSLYCVFGPLLKEARYLRRFGAQFQEYRDRHSYLLPWPRSVA